MSLLLVRVVCRFCRCAATKASENHSKSLKISLIYLQAITEVTMNNSPSKVNGELLALDSDY